MSSLYNFPFKFPAFCLSSCRSSRETSPIGGSSNFKTVGIPTYLRTCTAYKQPFTRVGETREKRRVTLDNTVRT